MINRWQAIHKGILEREKHGAGAHTVDERYELADNTTPRMSVGILAPGIEEMDSAIDNAEKAADEPQIGFAYIDPKVLADQIHADLPLNNLQRLVVERVLSHVIQAKTQPCTSREDQLFLYVRGEGGVGKSQVIKALQLGFLLLKRSHELAILAPTGAAANNIGGSTIHTSLSINKDGKGSHKIRGPWPQRSALIIDEISMLDLKMLATIDQQLLQAKRLSQESTAVFRRLSLVLLIGDFYQFAPITG